MKLVFSWDDGAVEDLKLFELHNKYELPAIFFVPTRNQENRNVLNSRVIKQERTKYVQFGGHTENHSYLTRVEPKLLEDEIRSNKEYLADILGEEIRHFCLPGGKYNTHILNVAGKYFDTIRTADTMNFKKDKNKSIVCRPSVHFYPRGKKSLIVNGIKNESYQEVLHVMRLSKMSYFDILLELIKFEAEKTNREFVIWGHSWEIEQLDLWRELEKTMRYIACEYKENCVIYDDLWQ